MKKFLIPLLLVSVVAFAAVTPNMLLDVPAAGSTNYVQKITTIFSQIDAHDHTTGKGVQISTGGIANGAIGSAQIATGAVGNANIANNAITTAKILDSAVTTAKIADASVTTAKIVDGNVAQAKLQSVTTGVTVSAGNAAVSVASGFVTGAVGAFVDIPNLSVTITTTGRPVRLMLISGATSTVCSAETNTSGQGSIQFLRGSSPVSGILNFGSTVAGTFRLPCSSFQDIDFPGAGTHTYKVQYATSAGTLPFGTAKLFVMEL